MTRRKRLLSDVAVAFAVLILAALGTWQVQRLHWKEELIAERTAKYAAAPISSWDQAAEFRRARFEGRYLTDKAVKMGLQGRMMTPFALADGSVVLVDTVGQAQGSSIAEGHLRPSEQVGSFTPDNRPDRGEWFTADVLALAAALKLDRVRPWRIVAGPPPELPNDHLQYAITWYSLGLILIVIYLLARRKFATA
jgi:surfeit locus 1 family protein